MESRTLALHHRLCPEAPLNFCRRPSSASDEEIFENEIPLTAMQGATATNAKDLTIRCRFRWGLDANNFVRCLAVVTIECHCRRHIRHNPKPPSAPCQRPKITSSAANARMPVTAPKKISERSRMRMLSRQLNRDGKNFTI
jgi:hypothetical protein